MHPRRNFELRGQFHSVRALVILALAAGLLSASAQQLSEPVDPYSVEFEKSPPEANIISRQWQERARQEKQEQFVLKVALPQAVKPMDDSADAAAAAAAESAAANSSLLANKNRLPDLGLTALVLLALALISRKLAPMLAAALNSRYNPWLASPAMVGAAAANLVAEEQSFSEFVAAFRIGPSPRPAGASANQIAVNSEAGALRRFFMQAPKQLVGLRSLLQQVKPGPDHSARKPQLEKLRAEVRSLKGMAGLPELLPIWQMACAMEGLLGQLITKGQNVTLSTLRTVAQAVDLLESLSVPGLRPDLATNPPIRLLAVDDDPISRHAVSFALKKALNGPDLAGNADAALPLCEKTTYDAIFLDVQMPGMDGFELCSKIHQLGTNRTTPVVFVTCQSDFEARAKSTLVGGNDLMGKPFLTFEITLKALTLVLRGRLERKPEPIAAEASETKATVATAQNEPAAPAKVAEPQKAPEAQKMTVVRKSTEVKTAEAKAPASPAAPIIEKKGSEAKAGATEKSDKEKPLRRKRRKKNQPPMRPRSKDKRSRHGKSGLKTVIANKQPAVQLAASPKTAAPAGDQKTVIASFQPNGASHPTVTPPPADSSIAPIVAQVAAPGFANDSQTGPVEQPAQTSDTTQYIRNQLNSLSSATEADRAEIMAELCLGVHSLTSEADRIEQTAAFRLSWALQGMLRKLLEKPDRTTASAMQTAGNALSLLDDLRRAKNKPNLIEPAVRIMIVDDDPVARRAITGAIQLSFAKPETMESGELAVAAAAEKPYDLIFLDVRMPGMDGFAAARKIRETVLNSKTPIVFVTSHTDQELQRPCAECGGKGFIPKPAMATEVTLTALTQVLRHRLS